MSLVKTWNTKSLYLLFGIYVLITLLAAAQGLLAHPKVFEPGGPAYPDYNNYVIFKDSFYHLLRGQDIYRYFPADHWDLYKYSPTFSVLFSGMAVLPDYLGLPVWLLLNSFVLFAGIILLPGLSDTKKALILLFCVPELLLSLQNDQSNALMAGLIILGFALAERSRYFLSALCIVCSVYIKLFGGLAFVWYLFYPGKIRLALYSLFWMAFMAFLPLLVVDLHQLLFLYQSWVHLVLQDRSASVGMSVEGILETWGHLPPSANTVTLIGLLLFCVPLLRVGRYKDYAFRILMLSSVLIWIVIFNHKAESPTFIIAMAGIGIWYFAKKNPGALDLGLLIGALVLTSLSVSDLVPQGIRTGIVRAYDLKAVMPLLVWCRIFQTAILPTVRSGSPTS
jgi:hypothetical protein